MSIIKKPPAVDFSQIRNDFPIFKKMNCGKPLVFLDTAASAQKPQQVIDAVSHFYSTHYANIHRGIYSLSAKATELYEETRSIVKNFIHAGSNEEIIFVRGATEGINLVAQSFGMTNWQTGDEIILSEMEHHSNIVPWYFLKERHGITLKIIPVTDRGELDLDVYRQLFSAKTKMVAVTHASNVLGTINPVKEMTSIAHTHGVPILIDGAQAAPHLSIDVKDLDCDFYVFSGHKLYGPTGVGILYGKKKWLTKMPPYQGGGSMIETVSFDKITYAPLPQKFEAGTPDIAAVIGFGAAIRYIQNIGLENLIAHDQELLRFTEEELVKIPGLRMIGTAHPRVGVFSFVMDSIHPHDIGTVLDHEGVAVRAGHHCAMPLMERFKVPAVIRVSLGVYNNEEDIRALITALHLVKRMFA